MGKLVSPIAVLGAGSWGTALAILLAQNGQDTRLWGNDPQQVQQIKKSRENVFYLPGISLPERLIVTSKLEEALTNVVDILIVVPSHAFFEVINLLKQHTRSAVRIAWGTKGFDPRSHHLLHKLVYAAFGEETPVAVLSGPSFAKELAKSLPTAITLASNEKKFAKHLAKRLINDRFRVYFSNDIIGVQVAGGVKNVLAIATGISDGLQLGANARCALITRGLAEMTRLGLAMGGKRATFMGLAGLGDLVLTCTDDQSRNRRFGLAIGQGNDLVLAQKSIGQVVEGIGTVTEVRQLAKEYQIEMPITEQIYQIAHNGLPPKQAVINLLTRESKTER